MPKEQHTARAPPASERKPYAGTGAKPEHKALDAHRIEQRRKQIEFGKNTRGYDRYLQLVPKDKRARTDIKTPDIHSPIGKRQFDGQVRAWRRQLHKYDDMADGEEDVFAVSVADDAAESPEPERNEAASTGGSTRADAAGYDVDIFGDDDITAGLLYGAPAPARTAAQTSTPAKPPVNFLPTPEVTPEKPAKPVVLASATRIVVAEEVSQPAMDTGAAAETAALVAASVPPAAPAPNSASTSSTAGVRKTMTWRNVMDEPRPVSTRGMSWADMLSDEELSQPPMFVA